MLKRLLLTVVMAGTVTACGQNDERAASSQATSEIPALSAPNGACTAVATTTWEAGGARYLVTGAAGGAECARGEAVVTVRDASTNKVALSVGGFDVSAMSSTVFADVDSPETLQAALADWIAQGQPVETTASLPEWKPGEEQPMSGEFPFYPEDGTTRQSWAALRAAGRPMFCHVQGMESSACYALDAGVLTRIGLQSFPG